MPPEQRYNSSCSPWWRSSWKFVRQVQKRSYRWYARGSVRRLTSHSARLPFWLMSLSHRCWCWVSSLSSAVSAAAAAATALWLAACRTQQNVLTFQSMLASFFAYILPRWEVWSSEQLQRRMSTSKWPQKLRSNDDRWVTRAVTRNTIDDVISWIAWASKEIESAMNITLSLYGGRGTLQLYPSRL